MATSFDQITKRETSLKLCFVLSSKAPISARLMVQIHSFEMMKAYLRQGEIHVHTPKIPQKLGRAQGRGDDVRWAARLLATALRAQDRHGGRRHPGWQPRPRGQAWRNGRRGSNRQPPNGWPRRPGPRRPFFDGYVGPGRNLPSKPPRPHQNRRFLVQPRRGPPVGTIKVPRLYQQEFVEERRPFGTVPGGPLLGGPERSANDPQLPKKVIQRKTNRRKGKEEAERRVKEGRQNPPSSQLKAVERNGNGPHLKSHGVESRLFL